MAVHVDGDFHKSSDFGIGITQETPACITCDMLAEKVCMAVAYRWGDQS
jgi:hypothetical protein